MKIEINYKDVYIQDVIKGDVVKSFDIESEEITHREVLYTHLPIVEYDRQIRLISEDGSYITTSINHPMCYFNKNTNKWEYKDSGLINVGDIVKNLEGTSKIDKIETNLKCNEQFYDITVDIDNNFYAGNSSDNMLVVHNSSTIFFPWWHKEIQDVLVLKNNKGTDDNRVRHMDYGIQFSKLFYQRFLDNLDISLFSPSDVPGLYDNFGNNEIFDKLYVEYESNKKIDRIVVKARELMNSFAQERIGTGRLYVHNIDNANSNSPFKEMIRQSNLCVEISLPTSPLKTIYDIDSDSETLHKSEGEIALCVLAAHNLGTIKNNEELYKCSEYIVRLLDFVIEHQDYPINASKNMLKRRSIGVGVTNFAYWLAKQDLKYTEDQALENVDKLFEHIQYSLLVASNKLAEEFGACEWYNKTKYSEGILPIDRYNKNVDDLVNRSYECDWESLREKLINGAGLRHSVLTAIMPAESSAVVQNATNGIEPLRGLITSKRSKSGIVKQVAPEIHKLKNKYEFAYDMGSNKGYTNIVAVIQKWVDQSISANHYYEYNPDGISLGTVIKDILYAYKMGLKTLYYANTDDKKSDDLEDMGTSGCESGACSL